MSKQGEQWEHDCPSIYEKFQDSLDDLKARHTTQRFSLELVKGMVIDGGIVPTLVYMVFTFPSIKGVKDLISLFFILS